MSEAGAGSWGPDGEGAHQSHVGPCTLALWVLGAMQGLIKERRHRIVGLERRPPPASPLPVFPWMHRCLAPQGDYWGDVLPTQPLCVTVVAPRDTHRAGSQEGQDSLMTRSR